MTSAATSFDGSDLAGAIVKIDALSIDANDRIIFYKTNGNKVVVIKIPIA